MGEETRLEERYLNSSRRPTGRREAPPQRRSSYPGGSSRQGGYRDEPPRRRRDDDWDDEPPRRGPRDGRSVAIRVLMILYKMLVVLSVLVVAVYLGGKFLIREPGQKDMVPPSQNGGGDSSGGGANPGGADSMDRRGVYTIFLAATDEGGTRTDTMMVMRYDTNKQTVGVVSVPRDTLVAREKGHPHLVYGPGGVEQRVKDVSNMLGIPIDYYIKVNINGFIALVDELQGIDFYVPCNMNYDDPIQNLHIHYKEGQQHLTGQQTMEVARFRKNNDGSGYSDTGRTRTQQQLLVALAKKVLSWGSLTKINGFVEIFQKNVDTDLSLNDMLYFAGQAVNLDPSTGVETATLEGNGFGIYRGYRYCYELDPEKTLETVNRLINPYPKELTLSDMNLAKAQGYHR